MPSTAAYLAIGGLAAVTTCALTPLVAWFARRVGWVVEPDARRVHKVTTPDVGGIALFGGFAVAFVVARLLGSFAPLFAANSEPYGIILGAVTMFAVGLLDDIHEISAPAKVMGTVLVAVILVYFGVTMFSLRVPFAGVLVLSDDWVPLLTVVWLLVMTQAINLIDGLDGLAAGIVAIGAFAFFLYSQKLTDLGLLDSGNVGPLLAMIATGVCIGFLPHNFNPARIMMGDGGALLLGLLLAVSTSVVGGRADSFSDEFIGQTYFFLAPLAIPLLILGVPILDTLFAIIRRARRGQGLATADKGHLHHRLMEMGHGQRRTVLILWGWTTLLSAFVLYPVITGSGVSYIPIGAAMLGLVLYTVLHPQIRRQRAPE
jgi:UDP-GlcNAc:undecaprenyl-phosphate GlcNAc-1-phosphate transferase